ncbi:type III restriction endonuclease subunit R, partial [Candidatus Pacearchaeota archaeon CG_4_9_14_0_8_um_filter_35_24]
MALHKDFPKSPHEILDPSIRWFPADEALRKEGYEKLLPPLVDKIRKEVKQWRDSNYEGASETSKALLKWWFETEHPVEDSDGNISNFKYYFCQREAIESIIYLYEVVGVQDKHDLLRYD